ncbi:hypothetical protein [Actinoplanes sp. NPDC049599]|uniref:hypothetical protein n=1 Tax=Actinoplanes sp. NPDC049599 TaxID=3363903 RepID=UPI0037BB8F6A
MSDRFSAPFLAMIESLRMAPTFARGRRDARAGHVRHLAISGSLVMAQVRGPDDPAVHRCRIAVRAFGAAEWSRIEDDLAAQARYVADLLAGRMPPDINEVFARAGLTPLPLSLDEVAMDCSCERWPLPCVHLAATFYALAESFDMDPFGVFTWRGRGRDELLTRLSQLRGTTTPPAPAEPAAREAGLGELADFWGGGAAAVSLPVADAGRPDLLLDQLDPPPLRPGGVPLIEILRPAYRALPPDPAAG